MKIEELEDKLEDLCEDVQIILETITVVERAISNRDIKQEETCWVLFGIERNAKKVVEDTEGLVREFINMRNQSEKEGEKICVIRK